ncbi:MAG: uracil phosphoribosyltransferase [Elusimicrobia bacterium]|nr:uracil phosphoribosyltransferase [Elusimicrobiota bacterium]
MHKLTICRHPLVQDKLACLRDKKTSPQEFRRRMSELSSLMAYQVLGTLKTQIAKVSTPLQAASCQVLAQPVVFVAVLRAGIGLLEGLLHVAPEAKVGYIGLYRNEETLNPVRYYIRLPKGLNKSYVVLVDPMLATGGSAAEAVQILKSYGAKQISFLCLIAARAGVRRMAQAHPDVPVFTAGVDATLNRKGYIVPGLGDAGDRLFGTF